VLEAARFLMGSKDAPKKIQFFGAIKKVARPSYTKCQSVGKTPQVLLSPYKDIPESQCSCIFQELIIRGKYADGGL